MAPTVSAAGAVPAVETRDDDALLAQYPGRYGQATTLCQLLAEPGQPLPPALHLHDTCNLASTSRLVSDVLDLARERNQGRLSTVVIDPLTCPTAQLLWSRVLRSLSVPGASVEAQASALSDDSIDSFAHRLRQAMGSKDLAGPSAHTESNRIIILIKRAERMRDLWPEPVIEALYSLGELCDLVGRICIVTLSHLGASHFRSSRPAAARRGAAGAITIPFSRLGKQDFVEVGMASFEAANKGKSFRDLDKNDLRTLYQRYLSVAYDAFASDVRDLDEMLLLACCAWHPFILPLLDGRVTTAAIQPLVISSPGLFQDALDSLLTRKMTPQEWIGKACQPRLALSADRNKHSKAKARSLLPLPPAAAYLVLASFLASYNPARLDVRYFVRDESAMVTQANTDGTQRRRRKRGGALYKKPRRKARKQRHGADGESGLLLNRQALLGPRPFTFDRLLSIFQALITEAGLHTQDKDMSMLWEFKSKSVTTTDTVNRLLRLGLLARTSGTERLDVTMTLRANVSYETVSEVSKQVHFDLEDWLWDWS